MATSAAIACTEIGCGAERSGSNVMGNFRQYKDAEV